MLSCRIMGRNCPYPYHPQKSLFFASRQNDPPTGHVASLSMFGQSHRFSRTCMCRTCMCIDWQTSAHTITATQEHMCRQGPGTYRHVPQAHTVERNVFKRWWHCACAPEADGSAVQSCPFHPLLWNIPFIENGRLGCVWAAGSTSSRSMTAEMQTCAGLTRITSLLATDLHVCGNDAEAGCHEDLQRSLQEMQ